MKKMTIAFDMDGVLIDLMAVARPLLMQEYDAVMLDTDSFKLKTEPPITNAELWKVFRMCYPKYKQTPINAGATELFEYLYRLSNDPIKVITARPFDAAEHTIKQALWIANVPVSVDIVEGWENKLDFLTNYNYFVEDRRKTAYALAEAGKICFLVNRPYNVERRIGDDPPLVVRINDLRELKFVIEFMPDLYIQEVSDVAFELHKKVQFDIAKDLADYLDWRNSSGDSN